MKKDFGLNEKDYRPQKACELCGLIDATVHFFAREQMELCNICAEQMDLLD